MKIKTCNPSNQAPADLCLSLHIHWDQFNIILNSNVSEKAKIMVSWLNKNC
jgi:hypothetical protein